MRGTSIKPMVAVPKRGTRKTMTTSVAAPTPRCRGTIGDATVPRGHAIAVLNKVPEMRRRSRSLKNCGL